MSAPTLRRRTRRTCTSYPAPHAFLTMNGFDCTVCPLPRDNAVHDSTDEHLLAELPEGHV